MLIILVLSLWYRNKFTKDAMLWNSDPYFIGLPFGAAITVSKSPLNAASILLFLTAASCVLLNKKMGSLDCWIGVFIIALVVVTIHNGLVAYLLECLLWASLCQFPGAEYLCHKYFVGFHVCLYLDFLLECLWVVACVILFGRDWNIWIFCVISILS